MISRVIYAGQLIDGTGSEPVADAAIVIEEGRISAVGPADEVEVPDDVEEVEARDKTVMPGIIDGHQHVGFGLRPFQDLRANLAKGVTTVVGANSGPEGVAMREAIASGRMGHAARYFVCAVVGATGGHMHREDDNIAGVDCDGPWEVRKGVRAMAMKGVDFIKTAASGGFQWAHEAVENEDYTVEELAALVDEAHRRQKQVVVHAHSQPGLNHAIQVGCDQIHHGALIDEEALEGIKEKGLAYLPTLHITSEQCYTRESWALHMRERMREASPIHREGVKKAHEMGIEMGVGTDGNAGDAMHELMELCDCGLSPMEAIVAGTRNTARAMGVIDRFGTLEPGKLADLLIVGKDPLDDISVLYDEDNIQLVMKEGAVAFTDAEYNRHYYPRGE
ncbi:MAG: amidohydrolase family protein [Armatimonadota bacterium]